MRAERDRWATAGFVLVEVMAALMLVALAAMLTAPTLAGARMRDRVDARARVFGALLAYARGEAVRLGARVVLCRSDATAKCIAAGRPCGGGAADWSCGWAVVAADGERGTRLLRRIAPDARVAVTGATVDVVFTPPAGQVIGGFRSFEFASADASGAWRGERWRRCLRIAAGGRVRFAEGGCGAST
ncbi:Type II secretion system protein H [Burkholderia pseudomallei]|uniref:GspH/FimT family protein n=1 Tax=Burkholderia pseudomallei TaxID=28450 RepID=UPI0005E3C3BD|nr:GspH/FimT family protein [Burkholderia pseudomallei]AYX07565.1 type II secretion system protein GspH [Burkholderia pseudomallei]MCQ8219188.1 GspH/FimT family protein [Burkholderia pseudomallei]OMR39777.1 type II secretion system protein GspH [Burkholderia pseudomallei]OMR87027.1 type II secretion system protein GspH [Burkholderia pseudomallei]OMS46763.1 type II secretion system protein GspH [Burkholderia pseudomallei]